LLNDLKLVAEQIKKSVTREEYNERGQFGSTTLIRHFGSWFKALELACLPKTRNLRISNEELFSNLIDIWTKFGRQPHYNDLLPKPRSTLLPLTKNALELGEKHLKLL